MNDDQVTWLVDRLDDKACAMGLRPDRPLCWITSLSTVDAIRAQSQAPLSSTEYREFADRADAAERLARRRMTKVLVALAAGCGPADVVIGRTRFGGPEVIHPRGWHLSIAGRWPHLAIGVARVPLGVDIELTTEPPPPDGCFAEAELQALHKLEEDQGRLERLRWWCAKEAHAKLTDRARQMLPTDIVLAPSKASLTGRSAGHISVIETQTDAERVVAIAIARADHSSGG